MPGAADTTPPSAPTGLTATRGSRNQMNLAWTASTDNVGVTGYRIERCQGAGCTDFAQIGTPSGTTYSDTGLTASTTYRYRVRATTPPATWAATRRSPRRRRPCRHTAPTTPTALSATAISATQIDLGWTASTDNVGVTGYRVERCQGAGCTDFAQVGTPSGTTYSDTGLTASTTYRYRVRAIDAAGNLGAYSTIATATTPAASGHDGADGAPGLTATAISATRINLAWTASTDNVGVTGYRVERCQGAGCTNFAQVGTPTATTYSNTGLAARRPTLPGARDRCGRQPRRLLPIATATTPAAPDTTAPTAPTGLTATAISTTQINLAWTASTDNVGVTGYRVERCQGASCTNYAQIGTPTATTFGNTGAAATTYRYRVRAIDAAGNLGGYSAIVARATHAARHDRADGPDVADGHAGQQDPNQPRLDGVDRQRRGDRLPGRTLPGRGLHELRADRHADRDHLQRHRADARDDLSVPGAGERCGRQPRRLLGDRHGDDAGRARHDRADSADGVDRDRGVAQVNLAWTASTDNVAVTGYRVERCQGAGCTDFAQVGTPTGTTFTDSGLAAPTTYRYRVRAVDAAGNLSGYSSVATATTPDTPATPPGLVGAWAFNEGAGLTAADASGRGNPGTLLGGATWSPAGKYGGAMSFNGSTGLVRVEDSASLDLTTGMTLSAWINPAASQSGWRTILQKQTDAYFLNASSGAGALRPAGGGPSAPALPTWAVRPQVRSTPGPTWP